jgi:hypothetical protein
LKAEISSSILKNVMKGKKELLSTERSGASRLINK